MGSQGFRRTRKLHTTPLPEARTAPPWCALAPGQQRAQCTRRGRGGGGIERGSDRTTYTQPRPRKAAPPYVFPSLSPLPPPACFSPLEPRRTSGTHDCLAPRLGGVPFE